MIAIGTHPAWHPVFESLGYVAGYLVFRRRRAQRGDPLDEAQRWTVIAAAAAGALAGSRLLGVAEQWPVVVRSLHEGHLLSLLLTPGGKTIVGGLLGGWLTAELAKRIAGIHARSGDLFVLPLCVGIAIGRIGCFVAGLADDTYGKATRLPWAVDLGDHVARHPVQLYEIAFLALLGWLTTRPWGWPEGARFRFFLAGYLAWRIAIDFLKPQPLMGGMSLIQWTCVAGLCALALGMAGVPGRVRRAGV
ncbi:MAG TPA: prolipoprotein diacylglyceryl transferase family protein [Steroidobacteraceae bacterium]|nr:prolipoprotein diacylglyceryl transferase family protein [Steroidobacteraceae bacterium]